MKKLIFGTMVLFIAVLSSCTKTNNAEAFAGRYSVSTVENVTWGGSSGTLTDNGTLTITKVSPNRVQTSGYFNTFGEVVGNNLYLESKTTTDSSGTLTIVFGTGTLNGNVLTLTSTMTGRLADHGIMYPFNSTAQHTCIKQ